VVESVVSVVPLLCGTDGFCAKDVGAYTVLAVYDDGVNRTVSAETTFQVHPHPQGGVQGGVQGEVQGEVQGGALQGETLAQFYSVSFAECFSVGWGPHVPLMRNDHRLMGRLLEMDQRPSTEASNAAVIAGWSLALGRLGGRPRAAELGRLLDEDGELGGTLGGMEEKEGGVEGKASGIERKGEDGERQMPTWSSMGRSTGGSAGGEDVLTRQDRAVAVSADALRNFHDSGTEADNILYVLTAAAHARLLSLLLKSRVWRLRAARSAIAIAAHASYNEENENPDGKRPRSPGGAQERQRAREREQGREQERERAAATKARLGEVIERTLDDGGWAEQCVGDVSERGMPWRVLGTHKRSLTVHAQCSQEAIEMAERRGVLMVSRAGSGGVGGGMMVGGRSGGSDGVGGTPGTPGTPGMAGGGGSSRGGESGGYGGGRSSPAPQSMEALETK
jgi:hypothetical protein